MPIDPLLATDWKLVAGRTAVVVIDPQNDFLHDDGRYAKSGVYIRRKAPSTQPISCHRK